MTTRARVAAILAVLAAPALASCGGGGDGPMQATLGDETCTLEGDARIQSGRFAIEVENRTLRFASFGVISLVGDETIDQVDLAAERVRSRQLQRSRARSDVPPPFERWVVGADVEPTARAFLPVDVGAGRYAVLCYVHRNADERRTTNEVPRPERSYVAGELEVSRAPTSP